jgi:hypothetical protein
MKLWIFFMASRTTPGFESQSYAFGSIAFHPILATQAPASFQELSMIDARIQEIILNLEIPTKEQKTISCSNRFIHTTNLKAELQSLRTHLVSYVSERSDPQLGLQPDQLNPIRVEDKYQAFRLAQIIDHTKHVSAPTHIYSLEEAILRTKSSQTLFNIFLQKLNQPLAQPPQADQQGVINDKTFTIIEDIRINLELFDDEITQINRGNFFSSSQHLEMYSYYYQVAESTATTSFRLLQAINQKFNDYIKTIPLNPIAVRYIQYKIEQTKFLAGGICTKLGLSNSQANAAQASMVAATEHTMQRAIPPQLHAIAGEAAPSFAFMPQATSAYASSHLPPHLASITPQTTSPMQDAESENIINLEAEFDPFAFLADIHTKHQ